MGESDLIRNGSDVWLWSSSTNTARHATIPASAATPAPGGTGVSAVPLTPQQAADRALRAITPTTSVTTDPAAVVAGRSAYQLVLQPKDTATLIGTVRIAIDGKTHLPLRVQVFPRGSGTPAFEVGFTSFDPSVPAGSVFAFNRAPGAKVSQGLSGAAGHHDPARRAASPEGHPAHGGGQRLLHGGRAPLPSDPAPPPAARVGRARDPRQRPGEGCRRSPARGARDTCCAARCSRSLLTTDGRVAAGAVAARALYAALSAS